LERLKALWRAVLRYADHDDPLVAASNLVALVVVWNQPFYPLYIYWAVGPDIAPTFLTFLSTPFFLAVPLLSRFNGLAGRVMLPVVGIANTMLSAKAFGVESGVEIFLIPCALIAMVFFHTSERLVAFALAGLALLVFMGLHGAYGEPVHTYTAAEYAGFLKLNAISAGTLTAFAGLLAANLIDRGLRR